MKASRFNLMTRTLLLTATASAAVLASAHASAGSWDHSPRWMLQHLRYNPQTVTTPVSTVTTPTTTTPTETVVVEELVEVKPIPGGNGNGGSNPVAAPTPSAVAGGLALLGFAAARRRRHDAA